VAMETFVEVLSKGGGSGVALERMKPYLLSGDASGLRFTVSNALKDITYYHQMAQDACSDCSIAAGVKSTLEAASTGEPQAFVPELMRIIAQRGDKA
jgi:3-hydroxyisobutyrate dehydrogenase-like beta-hydroxyacid dehydrogenase